MRGNALLLLGLAFLVVGVGGLVLLGSAVPAPPRGGATAVSRGEWLFRTGLDARGHPLPSLGGMMMRTSCASCHGVDGHGLSTPMFVSPNITYRNLTDPKGMQEPDGSPGSHYTDNLIKRAITQGLDAAGKPLSWVMPRWHMTDRELDDFLAYLKTLT